MFMWHLYTNKKRLTKKALLSLRSPSKCSFTLSKLRFLGLRKPKNSSFYPTSKQSGQPNLLLGRPLLLQCNNVRTRARNILLLVCSKICLIDFVIAPNLH